MPLSCTARQHWSPLDADAYAKRFGTEDNPNFDCLHQLHEAGVEIYVCGQSLISKGEKPEDVLVFADVAVSALTTVVNLQAGRLRLRATGELTKSPEGLPENRSPARTTPTPTPTRFRSRGLRIRAPGVGAGTEVRRVLCKHDTLLLDDGRQSAARDPRLPIQTTRLKYLVHQSHSERHASITFPGRT